MDHVTILQYTAGGLVLLYLRVYIYPLIRKKKSALEVKNPKGRGRPKLIAEDLPNGSAEILSGEDQGNGKVTLILDDGFNELTRTYRRSEITYLSLMQQLAGNTSAIWITRQVQTVMTPIQVERIASFGLDDPREHAQEKIREGLTQLDTSHGSDSNAETVQRLLAKIKEQIPDAESGEAEEEKEFKCPFCDRYFDKPRGVMAHIRQKHKNDCAT